MMTIRPRGGPKGDRLFFDLGGECVDGLSVLVDQIQADLNEESLMNIDAFRQRFGQFG